MILIDKYAWFSGLKETNPLLKILFGGVGLIGCVCSYSLISFAIVFAIMSYVTVFKAKIPVGYYAKMLTLPLVFLMFSVIGIVVNIQTTAPEEYVLCRTVGSYHLFISEQGIHLAVVLFCKSLAAVSCLYFVILTTPVRDIVYFLYLLRCPKTIITLMAMIYQWIFLLMDIAVTRMKSQLSRGGYRTFRNFPKTFAMLWGSVFIQSRRKCEWIHKSMSSRGDEGHYPILKKDFRLNVKEIAALVLFFMMVILPNFFWQGL